MSLDSFLLSDEVVMGKCKVGKSTFYITNLRLIKHEEKGIIFKRTIIHDLSLSGVHGVSLEVARGDPWIVVLGLLFLAIAAYTLITMPPEVILRDGLAPFIALEVAIGLGAISLGLLHRRSYFQIKGPSLISKKEAAIWRIEEPRRIDVVEFVRILREQLRKVSRAQSS